MSFDQYARRFYKRLQVSGAYAANGRSEVEIQNIGYLAEIKLIITIAYTITLGGGTAVFMTGRGKTTGNPTPWDLIQRVSLLNNQNVPIVDCSGWGLALFNRTVRSAFDQNNIRSATTDYNPFFTASTGNATSGTIRIPLTIPVAYKKALQSGLLFMQDQQTNMRAQIQWGSGTIFTLAGGATAALTSVTVEAEQTHFLTLPTPDAQPNTAGVHRVLEFTQDITGTGEVRYKMPLTQNRVLQSLISEYGSNSVGMIDTDISSFEWQASGSDKFLSTSPLMQIARNQELMGGQSLPRGCYFWDFDSPLGVREFGEIRDLQDLSQLTSLELLATIAPTATISNAYLRTIHEYLETPV